MPEARRVLIVDDEPRIVRFMALSLKIAGFKVLTATDGEEALDLVRSDEPHIMLLDIIMPGTDGFEVLRQLRRFSQMPVIAFSAKPEVAKEVLTLGASDFVAKPFRPEDIIARIEAALDHHCDKG
jgi:DNA-binding response OmpR family regulator